MLKYRGQYRVVFEMGKQGKPCEFTFIPCRIKKGSNMYRHNDNTLNVYIPSAQIGRRLLREYPDIFTLSQCGDMECTLLFNETHMPTADKILKARTQGKNVSPRSKRNKTLSFA